MGFKGENAKQKLSHCLKRSRWKQTSHHLSRYKHGCSQKRLLRRKRLLEAEGTLFFKRTPVTLEMSSWLMLGLALNSIHTAIV